MDMLPAFCAETVTITRPAYVDERGTLVPDWSNASSHDVDGASVQPASTTEATGEPRFNAQLSATAWLPPDADVKKGDKLTWRGIVFSVYGLTMPWVSATGTLDHIVVQLRDYDG